MRFAHSNRGGATGAWPGNADTFSEEGSRFLFHALHTFGRQCKVMKLNHVLLPLL